MWTTNTTGYKDQRTSWKAVVSDLMLCLAMYLCKLQPLYCGFSLPKSLISVECSGIFRMSSQSFSVRSVSVCVRSLLVKVRTATLCTSLHQGFHMFGNVSEENQGGVVDSWCNDAVQMHLPPLNSLAYIPAHAINTWSIGAKSLVQ